MATHTPSDWLTRVALEEPGRVCLVSEQGELTYGEVSERVVTRAKELANRVEAGTIMPTRVALDVGSIVELLAIDAVGGVPLPHIGDAPQLPVEHVDGTAVCVMTSGSGGESKIVPLSHENISAAVRASRRRLWNSPEDRWLLILPLSHVGGLSVIWRSLEAGGSVVVTPFDAAEDAIIRHRPSFASMVPTMVHRLVGDDSGALSSVGTVLVGGAALTEAAWDRAHAGGVRLVPTYGLTEAASQVATMLPGDPKRGRGLVGKPLEGVDVTIVDSSSQQLPVGESGLVAVEGDTVFRGYLGEGRGPSRYVTSDIGHLDGDGYLFIEGRVDDIITSGGENVSLDRVADLIRRFGDVHDVCVVAIDDPEWGSVAGAMVVSGRDIEWFDTMARQGMKPHERPKRWLKRSAIPLLENGKYDKDVVRAALEEEPWT